MAYPYLPLRSERSIRLLQLEKPLDSKSPLEGKLVLESLDSNPVYNCLSYTWSGSRYHHVGPEWFTPTYTLVLDGIPVLIRRNLYEALTQIRALPFEDCIWVDALCIDQENISERNSQVSMMDIIYKGANEVLIWLGTEDNNTRLTLDILRRCTVSIDECVKTGFAQMEGSAEPVSWPMIKRFYDARLCTKEKELIVYFYISFAWFSRIWTLQEIVLAERSKFIIGECVVGLDLIWGGSFLLGLASRTTDILKKKHDESKEFLAAMDFGSSILAEYFRRHVGGQLENIGNEANSHRTRVSVDPRDKVFGVRGISRSYSDVLKRELKVDYGSTVQSIYTEAQLHYLCGIKGYIALSNVGDRDQNTTPGLPTWVPDFTQQVSVKPLLKEETKFSAATKHQTNIFPVEGVPEVLCLPACFFDTIEDTCSAYWDLGSEEGILDLLRLVIHPSVDNQGNYQDVEEAMRKTLMIDGNEDISFRPVASYDFASGFRCWLFSQLYAAVYKILGRPEAERLRYYPEDNFHLLMNELGFSDQAQLLKDAIVGGSKHMQSYSELDSALHRRLSVSITRDHMSTSVSNKLFGDTFHSTDTYSKDLFHVDWEGACRKRQMIRTKKGFLGLALPRVQRGDHIYLLSGAYTPHVFRHQANDPKNVLDFEGEAYVHGIMHGEVANDLEFKKINVY